MSKLIGTDPNQVPSNADLGTAAFADIEDFLSARGSNISQLKSSINATARDVFVYDTTKDSDGGAWRKRTQNTSWYNEPLNTETRGVRRDFPSIAVIVLESGSGGIEGQTVDFTIYDGDDPNLSMWMQYRFMLSTSSVNNSIVALNGKIVMGRGNNGILISDFIADRLVIHNHVHRHTYSSIYPSRLGRTAARSKPIEMSVTGYSIVNEGVNGLAMKVLPDALTDTRTGLPVPTIAVATMGGVSIIHNQGLEHESVLDITSTGPDGSKAQRVWFTKRNELLVETATNYDVRYDEIGILDNLPRTSDVSGYNWGWDRKYDHAYSSAYPSASLGRSGSQYAYQYRAMPMEIDEFAADAYHGFTFVSDMMKDDRSKNMVNYVSTDYQTGWQYGNCKLATLADTRPGNVKECNLIKNGEFTTDVSYWTDSGTVDTVRTTNVFSNGGMRLTVTGGGGTYTVQTVSGLTVGAQYILQADLYSPSTNTNGDVATIGIQSAGFGLDRTQKNTATDTIQTVTVRFTATATSQNIYASVVKSDYSVFGTVGNVGYYDNISVKEKPVRNRSIIEEDIRVIGTIKKSSVATGAELVGYSGFTSQAFSTRNYLLQEYSSDLQFGTGDFMVSGWFKTSEKTAVHCIVSRYDHLNNGAAASTGFNISVMTDGTLYFYTMNNNSASYTTTSGKQALDDNEWHHFVAVRYSTGRINVYVDGKLYSYADSAVRDIDVTSDIGLRIGYHYGEDQQSIDNLSLLRISQGAPSKEQVEKMYNDEKMLFQDNAKCTLYGNSTGVAGLEYDDYTKLLHVGTSDGRSTFQGLCRVDHSTAPITTTISAVNGFIAEE